MWWGGFLLEAPEGNLFLGFLLLEAPAFLTCGRTLHFQVSRKASFHLSLTLTSHLPQPLVTTLAMPLGPPG